MALKKELLLNVCKNFMTTRLYSHSVDTKILRSMILKRIENRAKDYPYPRMIPVAKEVAKARAVLISGVSTLLKAIPTVSCKFCSEVFISRKGHQIKTCCGYRRRAKNRVHEWIAGSVNDILVPVEAYHLSHMFQEVIQHNQRFDYERIPAVVELCRQAGAEPNDENLQASTCESHKFRSDIEGSEGFSPQNMMLLANETLRAWQILRTGVQKLLLVYPTKVCKYCSEVHIGPSGHKARLCGVFKYESWRGAHFWKKAEVDDLVPPNISWIRRPQDPLVLVDEGRSYYGKAPAIVDLCRQAGKKIPRQKLSMLWFYSPNGTDPIPPWRLVPECYLCVQEAKDLMSKFCHPYGKNQHSFFGVAVAGLPRNISHLPLLV